MTNLLHSFRYCSHSGEVCPVKYLLFQMQHECFNQIEEIVQTHLLQGVLLTEFSAGPLLYVRVILKTIEK